jgi:hypothetical protein
MILEFGVHSRFVRDLSKVWGLGGSSGASSRDSHKNNKEERLSATCTVPECRKEFFFAAEETRVFELPMPLFERHFYRSGLL